MTASVAELIVRLRDDASARARALASTLGDIAKAEKAIGAASPEMRKLTGELKNAAHATKALGDFRDIRKSFADARQTFREAQKNVADLARQMREAGEPTKQLERDFKRAQTAVKLAASEFEKQKVALLSTKSAMEALGIGTSNLSGAEDRLRGKIDQTTAALNRQAQAEAKAAQAAEKAAHRRQRLANAAGIVGGIAAYKAADFGKKAVVSIADFDIATRKQRVFTDISPKDQESLMRQAKRIGQETQFTNLDVVKAQTKTMQGLPTGFTSEQKSNAAEGILDNVKNYAIILETDLEKAAEGLRAYLQTFNKDISTKEKAVHESQKATNQLVKMAKLGGMSAEDVQNFMTYAAPSASVAGIDPETAMTVGALLRRGGIVGQTGGVAMRAAASKLVAPTKAGISALNAAGINYSDYVKPGAFNAASLQNQLRMDMGLQLSAEAQAKLAAVVQNDSIRADRGMFTKAVVESVMGDLPKNKKGNASKKDMNTVAKSAGVYHKLSAGGVKAEELLDRIMSSPMTLAQLNAFFTDKHGGKFAITQRQREEWVAARAAIKKSGDDPNFAKGKADDIMGGVGGSLENLKGSVENLILSMGKANEDWLKPLMDSTGKLIDGFSELGAGTQKIITGFGILGAGFAAFKALGLVSGFGLTGSAAALTGSAEALTLAAARLGGSPLGKLPSAPPVVPVAPLAAGGLPAAAIGGGVLAGIAGAAGVAGTILNNKSGGNADHRKWTWGRLFHNFTSGGDTLPSPEERDAALAKMADEYTRSQKRKRPVPGIGGMYDDPVYAPRPWYSNTQNDYTLGNTRGSFSFRTNGTTGGMGRGGDMAPGNLSNLPTAINPSAFGPSGSEAGSAFWTSFQAQVQGQLAGLAEQIRSTLSVTVTPTITPNISGSSMRGINADVGIK